MRKILLLALIVSPLMLSGCGSGNQDGTIKQFIQSIKNKVDPPKKTPQTDNDVQKEAAASSAAKVTSAKPAKKKRKRNPFVAPSQGGQLTEQNLAGKLLNNSTLVGIMTENNKKWAIIRAADAKLYIVSENSTLVGSKAKVTKITSHSVRFMVPDGDQTRQVTLKMQGPKR